MIENYSLCLNELLRASCPPPFGPAGLFKFVPDELVRKNLAAKIDRSPLIEEPLNKSYGDHWLPAQFGIKARLRRHASAWQEVATRVRVALEAPKGGDQDGRSNGEGQDARSNFVPFMQYAGWLA